MNSRTTFKEFLKVINPILEKIAALAPEEHMKVTKFFSREFANGLIEGSSTGVFQIPELNPVRNLIANFDEALHAGHESAEIKDAIEALQSACMEYYELIDEATDSEEKCMYGFRQALLLLRTGRLTSTRMKRILKELNAVPIMVDEVVDTIEDESINIIYESAMKGKETKALQQLNGKES